MSAKRHRHDPHRRLADILTATDGCLEEQAIRRLGIGGDIVRRIYAQLDALHLTARVPNRAGRLSRVLVVPLPEAVQRVGDVTVAYLPRVRRANTEHETRDVMRVIDDPHGLFTPGSEIRTVQVLPVAWKVTAAWLDGVRFVRYRDGQRLGEYITRGGLPVPVPAADVDTPARPPVRKYQGWPR
jgi:hypothetical protein